VSCNALRAAVQAAQEYAGDVYANGTGCGGNACVGHLLLKLRQGADLPGKTASPSTQFSFKLFRQLASEQENRNLFFSPRCRGFFTLTLAYGALL
jgi:hypothetical protein